MAALHRAGLANIPTSRDTSDGLRLDDAFIAAAVRCAPPDNKPTPGELANCLPHLAAEIEALPRVRVILALGKIGFDACVRLLKQRGVAIRPQPRFAHASVANIPGGPALVGCYHPSRQNTNTGKLTPAMMDRAISVAKQLLKS
jgi:uracil-DNA glycosylase family 4